MAQYRVTIIDGEAIRQPVCDICHEVIRGTPTMVVKTWDGEGGELQTEPEYVHEKCLEGLKGNGNKAVQDMGFEAEAEQEQVEGEPERRARLLELQRKGIL